MHGCIRPFLNKNEQSGVHVLFDIGAAFCLIHNRNIPSPPPLLIAMHSRLHICLPALKKIVDRRGIHFCGHHQFPASITQIYLILL